MLKVEMEKSQLMRSNMMDKEIKRLEAITSDQKNQKGYAGKFFSYINPLKKLSSQDSHGASNSDENLKRVLPSHLIS